MIGLQRSRHNWTDAHSLSSMAYVVPSKAEAIKDGLNVFAMALACVRRWPKQIYLRRNTERMMTRNSVWCAGRRRQRSSSITACTWCASTILNSLICQSDVAVMSRTCQRQQGSQTHDMRQALMLCFALPASCIPECGLPTLVSFWRIIVMPSCTALSISLCKGQYLFVCGACSVPARPVPRTSWQRGPSVPCAAPTSRAQSPPSFKGPCIV